MTPIPALDHVAGKSNKPSLLDRRGKLLSYTIEHGWNVSDHIPLHEIPPLLLHAFILSEDQRFYQHHGIDWIARLHALEQDIMALKVVRGASTISEQVVRMIHPRTGGLWSKWTSGFAAAQLEKRESKTDILEFYLNQVPYTAERRGVKQAAYYYFDRGLDTLSDKEQLALAVIVRAPGIYSADKNRALLNSRIHQLAKRLYAENLLSTESYQNILQDNIVLAKTGQVSNVFHFANFVWGKNTDGNNQRIRTTIDSNLQDITKKLLEERLKQLKSKNANNGAVLVVDHQSHEILAWVVSGDIHTQTSGAFIDAVTTPRQPGSTLKPFIYTMALEKGWTAATIIRDEPLQTAVGNGLHSYHNYSHTFYGDLTLRETLANSLNIPAVKTLEFVGRDNTLAKLKGIGINDLTRHPSIYGAGLALGNGEVSLFELVQAYTALADKGVYKPLQYTLSGATPAMGEQAFSAEATSIISSILADDKARQLEFGEGNSLSFPIETAAKTGTSTDYIDAWIIAYNYRYMVGIWIGNLDRTPMKEVTGSTGPALLAHGIFSELNRNQETRPLYLSRLLLKKPVCASRSTDGNCLYRDEWFISGTEPGDDNHPGSQQEITQPISIATPNDGLHMAMDPRIPDNREAFEFTLNQAGNIKQVSWFLDGALLAHTPSVKLLWPLQRGEHTLLASVRKNNGNVHTTRPVRFYVK